jgi:hypothetical protein
MKFAKRSMRATARTINSGLSLLMSALRTYGARYSADLAINPARDATLPTPRRSGQPPSYKRNQQPRGASVSHPCKFHHVWPMWAAMRNVHTCGYARVLFYRNPFVLKEEKPSKS